MTIWHPGTLPADLPVQRKRARAATATPLRGIGVVDPNTGIRWIFARKDEGDGIEEVPATLRQLARVVSA